MNNPPILPHVLQIMARNLNAVHTADTPYEQANARERFQQTCTLAENLDTDADAITIVTGKPVPFAVFILN